MRQRDVSFDEFGAFYASHKDRCLRAAVASGIDPGRAEDAVAEAFARAWAQWRTVRNHRSPAAWVVRTAVNADISWWRKRRREVGPPDDVRSEHPDLDGRHDLIAAIRRLPKRQREVVALRYILDLDTVTTSVALDISPGTVSAHLHHALATLRAALATEGAPS
ncbi:RNA polymerase sigma-70 factor, ECF subfamily [Nocardioides sp. YR527]|uniref:SigE family RNA polymerase sigma factor n=1 Tax=Nocardioides sp. YR527 TaxID=1881028 RepID=UPI000882A884|nr:SigE family RNA polymerase sigma factor [Nocardioides sp. YR527]SDK70863.1 RNA polymerase sigma-70 factor, ECF subfamily [Nocardioides sp. YR527]